MFFARTWHQGHRSPQHGLSGTRVAAATEELVHRPERARLPDAEQTRAKPMKPEPHIWIFGSGPTIQQGSIVWKYIVCPCKGPPRGEDMFKCRWTTQSIHLAAYDHGGQQRVPNNAHSVGNMVTSKISRDER